MSKKETTGRNHYSVKWYDYFLIILGIICIIVYNLFAGGIIFAEWANRLSNLLFNLINLIFVFYISFRITYLISQSEFVKNQKKLAKTSIRHLRATAIELYDLGNLIHKRITNVKNPKLYRHYLEEIHNLIKNITQRIRLSENDFKEIVNEEYEEENNLISKIITSLNEIKEKHDKLEGLQKQQGEEANQKIEQLRKDIQQKELEVDRNIKSLPFGVISSGASTLSTDNLINYKSPSITIDSTGEVKIIDESSRSETKFFTKNLNTEHNSN